MRNRITLLSEDQLEKFFGDSSSVRTEKTFQQLKDLQNQIKESDGQQYVRLVSDVNRSLQMLKRNYQDLIDAIDEFENHSVMETFDEDEQIQSMLSEFIRHLHNYLAMCQSLRDHTYRIKDKLNKSNLDDRYHEKITETGLATTGPFIFDFRNYIQHRRIPVTTGRTNVTLNSGSPPAEYAEILLKKPQLTEWDNWSTTSNEFLENHSETIDIRDVIERYQRQLNNFYDWLFEYLQDLYSEELNERRNLMLDAAKLQEEIYPGVNDNIIH